MAGALKVKKLLGKPSKKDKQDRSTKREVEEEDNRTDQPIARLSNLSDSTDEEDEGETTADDDESIDRYQSFERDLRQKHSNACKAMSVSPQTTFYPEATNVSETDYCFCFFFNYRMASTM